MPFKSVKQRAFMYSQHPEIAKRWEGETPKGPLPIYASGKKKGTIGAPKKDKLNAWLGVAKKRMGS